MFLSREIVIKLCKGINFIATNSDFLIPISLQPNVVDLRYFKLSILLGQKISVWNIKVGKPSGCTDMRIRKFEFVAKTQFLNTKIHIYIHQVSADTPFHFSFTVPLTSPPHPSLECRKKRFIRSPWMIKLDIIEGFKGNDRSKNKKKSNRVIWIHSNTRQSVAHESWKLDEILNKKLRIDKIKATTTNNKNLTYNFYLLVLCTGQSLKKPINWMIK